MKKRIFNCLHYFVLIIFLLIVLIPVIWGFTNAFRTNDEIMNIGDLSLRTFVPEQFTLENFAAVFTELDFLQVFRNTLTVALTVTAFSLLFNSMAGYAFARLSFFGKNILFAIILSTLIMPMEILVLPLYTVIMQFGLVGQLSGVIIPFLANAFGIFFMRQFFMGIPRELDESAYIDGCGYFKTFFHIMMPLTKTPLATLGLIAFLTQWDNFLIPLTFLTGQRTMLLQVALSFLARDVYIDRHGLMFAGLVVSSIPIMSIFISLQKYYVEGIATSGIKG